MEENMLWNKFENSGKVDDYLTYKGFNTKDEIKRSI